MKHKLAHMLHLFCLRFLPQNAPAIWDDSWYARDCMFNGEVCRSCWWCITWWWWFGWKAPPNGSKLTGWAGGGSEDMHAPFMILSLGPVASTVAVAAAGTGLDLDDLMGVAVVSKWNDIWFSLRVSVFLQQLMHHRLSTQYSWRQNSNEFSVCSKHFSHLQRPVCERLHWIMHRLKKHYGFPSDIKKQFVYTTWRVL